MFHSINYIAKFVDEAIKIALRIEKLIADVEEEQHIHPDFSLSLYIHIPL